MHPRRTPAYRRRTSHRPSSRLRFPHRARPWRRLRSGTVSARIPNSRMTGFAPRARSPRSADQDQMNQSARTMRTMRTIRADQSGKVLDHVNQAGRRSPDRPSLPHQPVTSMPPRSPPTAPASGKESRCPNASWQHHSARPHGGGRAPGWPKPGSSQSPVNRECTGRSAATRPRRGERYPPICSATWSPRRLTHAMPNWMFCVRPSAQPNDRPTPGSADVSALWPSLGGGLVSGGPAGRGRGLGRHDALASRRRAAESDRRYELSLGATPTGRPGRMTGFPGRGRSRERSEGC